MTNHRKAALEMLAEALLTDAAAIDDSTEVGVTAEWNSLAHMRLILLLEERLGRQLDAATIVGISGLSDVIALLSSPND